jgi:hypothetical protein
MVIIGEIEFFLLKSVKLIFAKKVGKSDYFVNKFVLLGALRENF